MTSCSVVAESNLSTMSRQEATQRVPGAFGSSLATPVSFSRFASVTIRVTSVALRLASTVAGLRST